MENIKNSPKKGGKKINVKTLTGIGLLTALVVVLQFVSMGLRFSAFSITLTLIPIVVGSALYGWQWGAWLGLVFGGVVLATGDANLFLTFNVPATILVVLVKGAAAGACTGLAYKLIHKKNEIAAVLVSSIVAPVVNTGLFFAGSLLFFRSDLEKFNADMGLGFGNVYMLIIVAFIGINFPIELGTNLILNPVAVRLISIAKKKIK